MVGHPAHLALGLSQGACFPQALVRLLVKLLEGRHPRRRVACQACLQAQWRCGKAAQWTKCRSTARIVLQHVTDSQ